MFFSFKYSISSQMVLNEVSKLLCRCFYYCYIEYYTQFACTFMRRAETWTIKDETASGSRTLKIFRKRKRVYVYGKWQYNLFIFYYIYVCLCLCVDCHPPIHFYIIYCLCNKNPVIDLPCLIELYSINKIFLIRAYYVKQKKCLHILLRRRKEKKCLLYA